MEKFIKTANQIAEQIERWFLIYHRQEKSSFNGKEEFTIFNRLHYEQQNVLIRRMKLNTHEIPVLVLRLENSQYIINSTERFIWLNDEGVESLYYSDFKS